MERTIHVWQGKVWKSIELNKAAVKSQKRFPTARKNHVMKKMV